MFGGRSTFVLSNAGHIASLVNPPGNTKSTYWAGPKPGVEPDKWLKSATQHQGTWWDVWVDWNLKRSGKKRPASKGPGSARFPAFAAAPGSYVHQKA
jgi:polyhydroxyalkanoate synthase